MFGDRFIRTADDNFRAASGALPLVAIPYFVWFPMIWSCCAWQCKITVTDRHAFNKRKIVLDAIIEALAPDANRFHFSNSVSLLICSFQKRLLPSRFFVQLREPPSYLSKLRSLVSSANGPRVKPGCSMKRFDSSLPFQDGDGNSGPGFALHASHM